jgi:hypothetical protein
MLLQVTCMSGAVQINYYSPRTSRPKESAKQQGAHYENIHGLPKYGHPYEQQISEMALATNTKGSACSKHFFSVYIQLHRYSMLCPRLIWRTSHLFHLNCRNSCNNSFS